MAHVELYREWLEMPSQMITGNVTQPRDEVKKIKLRIRRHFEVVDEASGRCISSLVLVPMECASCNLMHAAH